MILFLLPECDYDPTEVAIPWAALASAGREVRFATPHGRIALADERLTDTGFSWLSPWLMTRSQDLAAYRRLTDDPWFRSPFSYEEVDGSAVTGLFIAGGHAPGMRTMLDSVTAQGLVADAFARELPVGAVCHGVLLAARAKDPGTGRSVLYGRRTTALTSLLELTAWNLTRLKLGRYYRTYPTTVQQEVTAALADPHHFEAGPVLPVRDTAARPLRGFTVRDGNYVSARWPGDCHRLAADYLALVEERAPRSAPENT
ncbi:DJ-1/PfpI family protein [Streptomyces sp. ADI96-02]|uniref:type 1 glutamine amidotransferase domain-containing protein n=1 Tax=Streptomyces sp. ADI96-02 TaxID=1522760 RepID=UPI000F555AF8|nr:type 1 glutamine amidotransferase domain-containing protein [Streptomyces sp. ADI96-02]RPK68216.1 DJ-1/PfpI family protein [Streptomyces sp. ADI96-02]